MIPLPWFEVSISIRGCGDMGMESEDGVEVEDEESDEVEGLGTLKVPLASLMGGVGCWRTSGLGRGMPCAPLICAAVLICCICCALLERATCQMHWRKSTFKTWTRACNIGMRTGLRLHPTTSSVLRSITSSRFERFIGGFPIAAYQAGTSVVHGREPSTNIL